MNKRIHPSPDDIAALLAGTHSSRVKARMESHLAHCGECARLRDTLESLNGPDMDSALTPPAHLRDRVLTSVEKILSGDDIGTPRRKVLPAYRPWAAFWTAGIATAAVITALTVFIRPHLQDVPAVIELAVLRGNVTVNDSPVSGTAVRKSDRLKTGTGSLAEIRYGNFLTVHMGNDSDLVVDNAVRPYGSRFPVIDLTLSNGSMFVSTDHIKGRLIVNAAGVAIRPVGTEFAVFNEKGSVRVTVLKGSVSLVHKASAREAVAHENQSCTAYETLSVGPASEDDLSLAATMKSGFTPVVPSPVKPNRKSPQTQKIPTASENTAQLPASSVNSDTAEPDPPGGKHLRMRDKASKREADSMRREIQRSRRGEYRHRR